MEVGYTINANVQDPFSLTGIFVNIHPRGDSDSPVNRIACGYPDGIVERIPKREQSVDIGMMQVKDGVESWGSRISMEMGTTENGCASTSDRWVTHLSCASNQDMDAIVDTLETVSLALSISRGMIAEGFPVVNQSQHGISVICNVPLRIAQNPIEEVFIPEQEKEPQNKTTHCSTRRTLSVAVDSRLVGRRRVVRHLE
jgi:hypothetical protein